MRVRDAGAAELETRQPPHTDQSFACFGTANRGHKRHGPGFCCECQVVFLLQPNSSSPWRAGVLCNLWPMKLACGLCSAAWAGRDWQTCTGRMQLA